MIREDFLHYVWKFRLFNFLKLKTSKGKHLEVINTGFHNTNSGPDFLNARILVDNILWVGDVEIHIVSSDWYAHQHHNDVNYQTIVLHVVYEEDQIIENSSSVPLFCLELKGLIPDKYITKYDSIYHSSSDLPCSFAIGGLDDFFWIPYTERLLVDRLEEKISKIRAIFLEVNKDYQECFYRLLSYVLGLKINSEAMLCMAEKTSFLTLLKHRTNRTYIEAILFGQSGLLNRRCDDAYPKKLKKEYQFFSEKYKLIPISSFQWKFFRLRPNSFPTLRISYLADFIQKSNLIFESLFNFNRVDHLLHFFNLNLSEYWKSHYMFDKKSKTISKSLGKATINSILINAVLPFCYFYAKNKDKDQMIMNILDSYSHLKPEKNKIVQYFIDAGVKLNSASGTQALIHLHQNYCISRKCLNCRVFNKIVK